MKGKNDSEGLLAGCGWLHPFVSLLRDKYPEVSVGEKKESGRKRKFNLFKRSAKLSKIVKE